MKSSTGRTKELSIMAGLLIGLTFLVVLSGFPLREMGIVTAAHSEKAKGQDQTAYSLSGDRRAALDSLYGQFKAGAPFSAEEQDILRNYADGIDISDLEADTLISRALFEYYVSGNDLPFDKQILLSRYNDFISPRHINVLDLKTRVLALEAKEKPRAPAVAPANDLCAGAEVIAASGPFPFLTTVTADITDATTVGDPPIPSCQASVSRSIWYTFTPTTTATYTISSCQSAPTGTTVTDTVIGIYTSAAGCAGPFTELPTTCTTDGCDDDSCVTSSLQTVLTTQLTSGTQYFIVVWKFSTSAPTAGQTAVQLQVSTAAAPSNDQCAGADVIPGAGPFPVLTTARDVSAATSVGDPPAPTCGGGTLCRSLWYTFTPTTSGTYSMETCTPNTTTTVGDTVLALYTSTGGCGGTLTQVASGCNDDGCGLRSLLTSSLTSGTQYFIVVLVKVAGSPAQDANMVQVRVNQVPPTPNDTCATPTALTLNTSVSGFTNSLTASDYTLTGTTCFTGVGQTSTTAPGRDVVYSFTAPSAGNYSFTVTLANGFNAVVYVATSCPGPPPQTLTCSNTLGPVIAAANRNTNTTNASESVQCLALTSGQQVFVFVDEVTLTASGGTFTIEVTHCGSAAGNETEPNGTPATANALVCGLQGGIVPAGDVDFYSLGTATGRVFAMADGASASSNDFDMRITTTTDTLEYDDLNLDTPFGSLAPTCAGTPLTGVASFIRMIHFSGTTQSEPYRLYSVIQPTGAGLGGSSATAETESNDTIPTANSAMNNYFSGTMGATTDTDFFCFNAMAGDVVFLSLDTDPLRNNTPFNGALALLDSSGNVLVSVNDSGSTSSTTASPGTLTGTTPNSPAEGIVYVIQTTGNYYARVTWSSGITGATADYLLSIAKNCTIGGGGCVVGAPDVGITKVGPLSVNCGDTITYTLTASNVGTADANATVTDDLPDCLSNVMCAVSPPAAGTCMVGAGNVVTVNIPTLATMGSVSITITATVGSGCCPSISNQAMINAAGDTTPSNNNSQIVTTTVSCPFVCSISPMTDTNPVNTPHTVTLTLTQCGNPIAGRTIIFDVTGRNNLFGFGTETDAMGQSTFTYTDTGSSQTSGSDTIRGSLEELPIEKPQGGTNCFATKDWVPASAPDVGITKSGPMSANCGDTITYTLTATNTGTGNATPATVTDDLPDCLSNVMCSLNPPAAGTCMVGAGNVVTATITSLAPMGSVTVTITATATSSCCGSISNQATISAAGDTTPGNNNSQVVMTTISCQIICSISPMTDTNPANTSHTVTIMVTQCGVGNSLFQVNIDVTGRNTTRGGAANFGGGMYTFTYTDTGPPDSSGSDTISACVLFPIFKPNPGVPGCQTTCTATKNWTGAPCMITCPNNVTQGNDTEACSAVVNYPAPMTTGTCGTVSCSPPSGSMFPVGTTTVNCTTTAGPSCSFTVTVVDNTPPTITCPNPVSQQNDPNQCGAVVTYPPPTVGDNCPGVGTPVCSPQSGSFFPVGTTTVTCRVSDATTCANIFAVDTSDNLVNFRTSVPGTISSRPIGGLGANEDVVGIDFRPATSQLFALARDSVTTALRLITINVVTGATTQVGALFSASGTAFGFDFNPTVDRLRITSDAETNLSVNPDTGAVTVQTPLNPGNPNVVGSAYTNNFVGATVTTLYAIDSGSDTLATQNPPANGTLATIGPLGVDTTGNVGFDISQCGGTAYAALESTNNNGPGAGSSLYTINLGTGQATLIGGISGNTIRAMSIEMARTSTCSFTVTVNDLEPPSLTCPGNINTAAAVSCPIAASSVVTYTTPVPTDNCPGATVACNPPSGSTFPVGCTTVTCTATDASGNMASCTFQVCVFSFCLQDETNPGNVVLVNVQTGDYIFCCNGVFVASGRGVVNIRGCAGTIEDNKGDRKVEIRFDTSVDGNRGNGSATIKTAQVVRCLITDQDISNNNCVCSTQAPGGKLDLK